MAGEYIDGLPLDEYYAREVRMNVMDGKSWSEMVRLDQQTVIGDGMRRAAWKLIDDGSLKMGINRELRFPQQKELDLQLKNGGKASLPPMGTIFEASNLKKSV